ncbi:oxidoreductase [Colletotrichum karsti]|uniref:Oxidoreductase n=1 Tax=Colletotrichum karsti TaxID=1095194 RepID=A0A9P6IBE4_9PEZI|nr:oxidoreductase [Colletotrichum karsti]KAF9880302.1 oxidoreductase [Colletotrichum karsti]
MSSQSSLKVLIVGGGIGGPALAFWLAQLGHDVTIVERNPDLRASGQQIDIRGQGVSVIRLMGIEPDIRAKVVNEAGIRFVNRAGKTQAVFEANKTGVGRQSFTSEFEIMRGDLVRLLFDRTQPLGVKYIFGNTIESLEQDTDSVTVRLTDGTTGTYDLVVGADGQGSRTRRLMLGPGEKDPFVPFNLHTALFTVPREKTDDNYATVCLLPKQRMMMTRTDNPHTSQVYMGMVPQDKESDRLLLEAQKNRDLEAQKRIWIEMFKDAGWQAPRFLEALEEGGVSDDFYNFQIGQVRMDKWYKNRVVLLGDAGYGPSPMSGKGTTSAFVGAYVIAGEITKHCTGPSAKDGIPAALEAYDKAMRPFMKTVQDISFRPNLLYPKSAWGITVINTILWLVSSLKIDKLFQKLQSDDVEGWQLPDYPALPVKGTKKAA